jgi:hypothetical protein
MDETLGEKAVYRDRTLFLVAIGVLLLLIGIAAAFLGPLEMTCFYFFSEGGRFHYEGFGFGSFMFGNMACQIIGYYVAAMLLIPLGYGHLKRRRWARPFSLALLWSWLVVGLPLVIVFFFILVTAKDLSLVAVLVAIGLLGLSYLLFPWLLIRFYRSRDVQMTFETRDPKPRWMERLPIPILALGFLCLFYAIVLHIPIFFNGIFPFFGTFLHGFQGIVALDVAIMCLLCLAWGTLGMRHWAWWGSAACFGLLASSSMVTFSTSSLADILSVMVFAPTEMEALQGIPIQGFHLAVFFGCPLLATLGLVVFSRRCFWTGNQATRNPK